MDYLFERIKSYNYLVNDCIDIEYLKHENIGKTHICND